MLIFIDNYGIILVNILRRKIGGVYATASNDTKANYC